jgi:chaperonin GroES
MVSKSSKQNPSAGLSYSSDTRPEAEIMSIRPLFDRILVKRVEEATRSAGGLFLPETAKEKPAEGEVLAVGQGRVNDESGEVTALQVKVGDKVVFGKYAGTEIKVAGEDRIILREDDILGILE